MNENASTLAEEIQSYKQKVNDLEKKENELSQNYDKDSALWEGKYKFMEERCDQLKRDLQEKSQKLGETILQIQRKPQQDDNAVKQVAMAKIVETQYKEKLVSISEGHNALVSELNEKNKVLQSTYNTLFEKHEIISRQKSKDSYSSEKLISDLQDNEVRLTSQIDQLKQERDKKMLDHQQALDKEREVYKVKLHDADAKT